VKGYADTHYLDNTAQFLRRLKERSIELMRVAPGHRILDVGCGPGTDTVPLGRAVGRSGWVVGLDHDPAMLAEANARARAAGVEGWVRHIRAGGDRLPFDDAAFHACHSERVFQHQPDPGPLLGEMVRVTRPNGWVVVVDIDYGTMSIDTPQTDLERRITRAHAELTVHNGFAGRQLYRQFRQQGLVDVVIEPFTVPTTDYRLARAFARLEASEQEALKAGIITPEELASWQAGLERAAQEQLFFASVSMVIAAGRRAP